MATRVNGWWFDGFFLVDKYYMYLIDIAVVLLEWFN